MNVKERFQALADGKTLEYRSMGFWKVFDQTSPQRMSELIQEGAEFRERTEDKITNCEAYIAQENIDPKKKEYDIASKAFLAGWDARETRS